MKAIDGDIISQDDWFTTQNMMFTYSEEEQEENKIAKNNADCVFRPKFIPVYPAMLQHFSLIEAAIFGFIDFYLSNNERFYWSNEKIAEMLNISERSVTWAISHLEKEWLIKTKYRIKAWWGKIRFIEKQNITTQTRKICYSNKKDMLDIYNNIINNNIIDIKKEKINKKEKKEYWEFKHIKLTEEEYEKIRKLVWWWINRLIEECDTRLELHPKKKYTNFYAFLKNWVQKNQKRKQNELEIKQQLYNTNKSKYKNTYNNKNIDIESAKQKNQEKIQQQFLSNNYNNDEGNQDWAINRRREIWGNWIFQEL